MRLPQHNMYIIPTPELLSILFPTTKFELDDQVLLGVMEVENGTPTFTLALAYLLSDAQSNPTVLHGPMPSNLNFPQAFAHLNTITSPPVPNMFMPNSTNATLTNPIHFANLPNPTGPTLPMGLPFNNLPNLVNVPGVNMSILTNSPAEGLFHICRHVTVRGGITKFCKLAKFYAEPSKEFIATIFENWNSLIVL